MPGGSQVFYLALDAVDSEVMIGLVDRGEAPHIARLLGESAVVPTVAPEGFFVSAQWPTFSTARSPSHHQYYCWKQFVPGTYDDVLTTPRLARGQAFWEAVGTADRRVAVFDVPHSWAPDELNGVLVAEWGCHDRHFGTGSYPATLAAELTERHGEHPIGCLPPPHVGFDQFAPCDYRHRAGPARTPAESAALWHEIVTGQERKVAASLDILGREPWDLFISVLGEGHCTGHQFWSAHDPAHPWHDPEVVAALGQDPVEAMYRRLDAALGAHLDRIDPSATVYVHLTHGMGPHYDGTHLLDEILRRLAAPAPASRRLGSQLLGAALDVDRLGDVLAPGLRRVHPRRDDLPDLGPDPDPVGNDRDHRPYFAIPNNTVSGAIRVNLAGREPAGVVRPGADYDETLEWLSLALGELVNADTGRRLVTGITRVDEIYERSPGDPFPDLLVEWDRTDPIERAWSPRTGLVERRYTHWRSGDHHVGGLLLARGAGITPGRRSDPVATVDLGVTVAAATGVRLADVDGAAIPELLPEHARTPAGDEARPSVVPPAAVRRTGIRRRAATSLVPRLRGRRRGGDPSAALSSLAAAHHETRWMVEGLAVQVDELREELRRARAYSDDLAATIHGHRHWLESIERRAQIGVVTDWVSKVDVPDGPCISIVLPTKDRCQRLQRAVQSVLAQTYQRWELVIVDDGSSDGTSELLAGLGDARIVVLRTDGVGVAAARNLALGSCTGDVVTYLDDDNLLDPLWTKALAWAFEERPEIDVAYGARVIDDLDRVLGGDPGALPSIHFERFDRDALRLGNMADMGVIAHRRGIAGALFDESLHTHADWMFFASITEEVDPLALPVVACFYFSDESMRLSNDASDLETVRTKLLDGGARS